MEIVGYSNYLIYDDGRVYSKKTKRFLKEKNYRSGYRYCALCKKGEKPKNKKIHRLVALHYIPNPENKSDVDHINRNKQDNRVENLRWATRTENMQNRGINKNNKIGIKNICKDRDGYIYVKEIKSQVHRKYFKTLEEAIQYKKEYESRLLLKHS